MLNVIINEVYKYCICITVIMHRYLFSSVFQIIIMCKINYNLNYNNSGDNVC